MRYFLVLFFSLLSFGSLAKNKVINNPEKLPRKQISQIIVNNKIITNDEIDERFEFIIKTTKLKINQKNQRDFWRKIVIERMIEEELILQKAKFYKIEINKNELDFTMSISTTSNIYSFTLSYTFNEFIFSVNKIRA